MRFARICSLALTLIALSGTACSRDQKNIAVAHDRAGQEIQWYTDYDQAVQVAKREHKPLFLFFTGSDWCRYCKRLESEVLQTADFVNKAGKEFIFVELDFPQFKKVPERIAEQNHKLAQQFKIEGYPTVIIVSPDGKKLGQTGYRRGGPGPYLDHLQSLLGSASQFESELLRLHDEPLAAAELQELYQRAIQLGRMSDAEQVLAAGLDSEDSAFFLAEQYRLLLMRGEGAHPEAVALRQKLLKLEGESESENHLRVALIEFQHAAENEQIEAAVAPLLTYLSSYAEIDPDSAWRVQMFLAQFLYNQGDEEQARLFADQGLAGAPEALRPNIEQFISSLWEE